MEGGSVSRRPQDIGTWGETATVRAAHAHGFPGADRLTKTGAKDRGDASLCPGVMVQVKAGNMAKDASDALVDKWLGQTEQQRANGGWDVAFLVVQKRGIGAPNAHRWHAYWRHGWIADLRGYPADLRDLITDRAVIRMSVESAFAQLRAAGYGEPLTHSEKGL